ncbi:uncharacterized protein [Musca autumnalis]|uniref:uncharacterized protein n=1 Tax=Musca autumnalis TaxID=221902 RepID=UPI003CEC0A32
MGEHKTDIEKQKETTALSQHALSKGHTPDFDNVIILDKERKEKKRLMIESLRIQQHIERTMNIKEDTDNISLNMAIYKRANGYRPFLYNFTNDICQFFLHPYRYPVVRVLLSTFMMNSNINHTCPYEDDIIVKDLVFDENMFSLLPLPDGQYMYKLIVFAYNDRKATVEVMFKVYE